MTSFTCGAISCVRFQGQGIAHLVERAECLPEVLHFLLCQVLDRVSLCYCHDVVSLRQAFGGALFGWCRWSVAVRLDVDSLGDTEHTCFVPTLRNTYTSRNPFSKQLQSTDSRARATSRDSRLKTHGTDNDRAPTRSSPQRRAPTKPIIQQRRSFFRPERDGTATLLPPWVNARC